MAKHHLPASETRRQYFKELAGALRDKGFKPAEANRAVATLLSHMQGKVEHGFAVGLGFMSVRPKRKGPCTIKLNVKNSRTAGKKLKDQPDTYVLGERYIWKVHLSQKWLKGCRPSWHPTH